MTQHVIEVEVVPTPVQVVVEPTMVEVEVAAQGVPGPQGPAGTTGDPLIFEQSAPAAMWIIPHNRGYRPPVTIFLSDDLETPVYVAPTYPDLNTIHVEMPSPLAGEAHIP